MAGLTVESEVYHGNNPNSSSTDETPRANMCLPCIWWTTFCQYLLNKQNEMWGKVGQFVASRPVLVISISLIVCGILASGFAFMKVETRTEKLFIPQDSRSITDLEKAEKYFTLSTRQANVLLQPVSGGDILTAPCFQDALTIHDEIKSIRGFSSLCIKSSTPNVSLPCLVLTPLELFNYNQSNFISIKSRLTALSNDPTYIMSNGRQTATNFPVMFGKLTRNVTTNAIKSAGVIHMTYYLHDKENDKSLEWEKEFSLKMVELKKTVKNVEIFFSTESSLNDAITESTSGDTVLISITFTIMITFSCFMLAKFLNPLTGHSNLAMLGVVCVGLGILSAFGLCMYIGIPFISLVGVLPFLVLGIGTDDMFIIVDQLDRIEPMDPPERIKKTMSHIGASITMTTVTDLVAFAVSTLSSFPAITNFCVYAALSITFVFLFQVTLFLSFVTFDLKRIAKGYRDAPPCMKAPQPPPEIEAWDKPVPQTSNKVMEKWANFLMLWPARITIFVISLGLLGGGIYGTLNITEEFDRRMLVKDGSEFTSYLNKFEEFFPQTLGVNIIMEGNIDYADIKVQNEIEKLDEIARNNQYYLNKSISWMRCYKNWAKLYNQTTSGPAFIPTLKTFLSQKGFSSFETDIVFNKNRTKIEASRLLVYYKSTTSSITQRDAMLSLREELDKKTDLPAYAIARPFIFFEQYAITQQETIRNLIIASVTILFITAPTLTSPLVIFLVFYGFVSLVVELLGLMYIWNVSLNSISMINLVMAIGFAVDYSAHVALAFVVSTGQTTEDRIVEALSTVGASVLMGGLSTFLGMLLTAFASSEVFRIFFRMFFGIVVLGLVHGLCFLPVLLSLFNCSNDDGILFISYTSQNKPDCADGSPDGNSWKTKPGPSVNKNLKGDLQDIQMSDSDDQKRKGNKESLDNKGFIGSKEDLTAAHETSGEPTSGSLPKRESPTSVSIDLPTVETVPSDTRSQNNTKF